MATKLPIKHYKTHTTTKIHGETIPTVVNLVRFNNMQLLSSHIGGNYLVITHEVADPPKQEIG